MTRMTDRRSAALASTALVTSLLAGCNGDTTDPTTSTTSSSTTTSTSGSTTSSSTTSTTASPTAQVPVKPKFPAAAKKQTAEGAEAFVLYFYALTNYAFQTAEGGLLKQLSTPDCRACANYESSIRSLINQKSRYAGQILVVEGVQSAISDMQDPLILLKGKQLEVPILDEHGNEHEGSPAEAANYRVDLSWTAGGWRVHQVANV